MEYLLELLFRIFETMISYLFIPIIILIIGKHYTQNVLKRIVIINGIIIYLMYGTMYALAGIDAIPNITATITWSFVAYKILKRNCLKNDFATQSVIIPIYNYIPFGISIDALDEAIIDTAEIPEELAQTGSFFGLQIHGNSMEPKFSESDVVIVRQQDDAESGDVVIATVIGTDATCKRLMKYENGIALLSTNPDYDPMFFTNQEIEDKPVRIIGRVVELRAKF